MKTKTSLSRVINLCIIFISTLFWGISNISAWEYGVEYPTGPAYCGKGVNCTISGGVEATRVATKGLFTEKSIGEFVTDVVQYFLGFVTLIGVIYVIYAGFQLMVGGGDEEKVKKARQIIIYVLSGIVLMWLSYALVMIILDAIKNPIPPPKP